MHTAREGSTSQSNSGVVGGTHHAGTINTSARDMIMLGCATTNNFTFTPAPSVPFDFRTIPLGDIDLQREIRASNSGVVNRHYSERRSVRRVYSAKIDGRKSTVTVAIYQGDGAEQRWREDIARYMSFRHPNIIQVYGTARSGNIHATIFHDDLIPFQQCLDLYRHSPILTVYIYAYCNTDFDAAHGYVVSVFQRDLFSPDCTFWIRRSTGRLTAELIQSDGPVWLYYGQSSTDLQGILCTPNTEAMVTDSLTLEEYHMICYLNLGQYRFNTFSLSKTVNLGCVICWSPSNELQDPIEIASRPNVTVTLGPWKPEGAGTGEVMEDGWTRFNSSNVFSRTFTRGIASPSRENPAIWLSQANHVFACLRSTSDLENYVLVGEVHFTLKISATTEDPPAGFLFLCPGEDLQSSPSSFFYPECTAYWSLNPSGVERLSTEEATRLGFPSIQLETTIYGRFWDASVYAGLRQFHRAKGFDPDSQDVARHLRYPFYQLSHEIDVPFAHVNEYLEDPDLEDVNRVDESNDTQSSANEDNDMDHDPGSPLFPVSNEINGPFAHVNEEDCDGAEGNTNEESENAPRSANEQHDLDGEQSHEDHAHDPVSTYGTGGDRWSLAVEDLVPNVQTIRAKHYLDGTFSNTHKHTTEPTVKRSLQDDLALRRLMLDEKAQLMEMLRLGIFTKEEFLTRLAQIEARDEAATRPTPAERGRLANSGDVERGQR
ncbi:hypothetical protein DFH09DRAFT_1186593 [Mycena vulgaris]|nr:hypothetical protein DFH09DRAFT_1186593 [Mycena vulgaris]